MAAGRQAACGCRPDDQSPQICGQIQHVDTIVDADEWNGLGGEVQPRGPNKGNSHPQQSRHGLVEPHFASADPIGESQLKAQFFFVVADFDQSAEDQFGEVGPLGGLADCNDGHGASLPRGCIRVVDRA